jgi:vacuolar protein sorting-associated protein 45
MANAMARGITPVDKQRSEALAQMHLIKILRAYILQMVGEVPGYKALLLDKDTMRICSTQFGRTEMAEHNVVHVECLDSPDSTEHLELKVSCNVQQQICIESCGLMDVLLQKQHHEHLASLK